MKITIEHHDDSFNISLASGQGKDAFLSIKGCRLKSGDKGEWVSFPARKMDSGKWWNHVWASEQFQAAVIDAYHASAPKVRTKRQAAQEIVDDDIPF